MAHRLSELDKLVREGYAKFDFQGVFQALFQFCTVDLSSFYLDIRKDALYCDAAGSPTRRAARAMLMLLLERLNAWLAPILVFTMEEIWLERTGDGSIHLTDFPDTPDWTDAALAAKMARIRMVRRAVTGALELKRTDKTIGASLEAAPVVHVDAETAAMLPSAETLADLCITSAITVSTDAAPAEAFTLPDAPGVAVVFAKAEGDKCQRCWKILPDVGTHAHPGTCGRCNDALG